MAVIRGVVFVLQYCENNINSVLTQGDPDTLVCHHAYTEPVSRRVQKVKSTDCASLKV